MMAIIFNRILGKCVMLVLGWLMIIQVMILPLQDLNHLPINAQDQHESLSDFLLNFIAQHETLDHILDQLPEEVPETENDPEEENSEKDETTFHEYHKLNAHLHFDLLDSQTSQFSVRYSDGIYSISTPPPEA